MKVLYLLFALFAVVLARSAGQPPKHKFVPMPKKQLGIYVLLADHTEEGFENNATKWTPELFEWQQKSANVLYFTFIRAQEMEVPMAYQKLAKTRGTNEPGAVPANTVILFAIGGYLNSLHPNPWPFLTSQAAAEEMAMKVAQWPELYGCDGIDLDLESGAGDAPGAGENMVHFVKKLKELQPNMHIGQPVYGYPQVKAENYVVNHSWMKDGTPLNVANQIGIMAYEGTQSLNYVKNYADATSQWEGFPIQVDVPRDSILLGCKGAATSSTITTLANHAVSDGLFGIMVWYASVKNGFQYSNMWDASTHQASIDGFLQAATILGINQS